LIYVEGHSVCFCLVDFCYFVAFLWLASCKI